MNNGMIPLMMNYGLLQTRIDGEENYTIWLTIVRTLETGFWQIGYSLQRYVRSIEDAIECSSRLDVHPDQNIADVGTTKVYQLGKKILELIPRIDGRLNL